MKALEKLKDKITNIVLYKKLNNLSKEEINKINIINNFIFYILFNDNIFNYCQRTTYINEYEDYKNYIKAIDLYETKTKEIENFKSDLVLEIVKNIVFNNYIIISTNKTANNIIEKLLVENNCTFFKNLLPPNISITIKEDTICFEQNNINNKIKITYKIINDKLKKIDEENILFTDTPTFEKIDLENINLSSNNYIKKILKK